MRTADRSSGIPAGDLTARARIRSAAIECFARDGFGVGLRAIAAEAGVTAGLVTHHFGSKEGLRRACDEEALAIIREGKTSVVGQDGATQLLLRMAAVDEYAPVLGYVLRSLQTGGELARTFIDNLVVDAERYIAEGVAAGTIRPSRDEAARARYLMVQGLGFMLLDLSLHPAEGPGRFVEMLHSHIERTAAPTFELLTEGFFVDRSLFDAYLAKAAEPPP